MSLSYQHIYHAGNPADIHKHLWLVASLSYLTQKDKDLFWMDTHSGRGLYDLGSAEALKTSEFREGLLPLLSFESNAPALNSFLSILQSHNDDLQNPRYYPGSAMIAASLIRPQDRMICCEMHPVEYGHLKKSMHKHRNVKLFKAPMEKTIFRYMPPHERRGGVLIDPSYEIKTEYEIVPQQILRAHRKWATGCFMLWYPMLPDGREKALKDSFKEFDGDILIDEWIYADKDKTRGMYGSGMVIINPPYTVPEQMKTLKEALLPKLSRAF